MVVDEGRSLRDDHWAAGVRVRGGVTRILNLGNSLKICGNKREGLQLRKKGLCLEICCCELL
jgi:hypothetical protein